MRVAFRDIDHTSLYHNQYLTLLATYLSDKSVFNSNNDVTVISWVTQARAEFIAFKYKPWLMHVYIYTLYVACKITIHKQNKQLSIIGSLG